MVNSGRRPKRRISGRILSFSLELSKSIRRAREAQKVQQNSLSIDSRACVVCACVVCAREAVNLLSYIPSIEFSNENLIEFG